MKTIFIPLLLLGAFLSACSETRNAPKEAVAVDLRGEWLSELEYMNDFFGVALNVPDDWHLQKGDSEAMDEAASEFLAGDDESLNSVMKSAIQRTFTVFWAYRHPPGTPGKTNPSVSMLIENVEQLPGIKTGGDYLLAMEDTLKMSGQKITFSDEPITRDVGGSEFWFRESQMDLGSLKIRQQFFAKRKDGHVLVFGVTLMGEDDEETTRELTETIRQTEE